MTDSDSNELPADLVKQLDQLSPKQQENLRRELNERCWKSRFRKLHDAASSKETSANEVASLGRAFSTLAVHVIDRLESGEMDDELRNLIIEAWNLFLHELKERRQDAYLSDQAEEGVSELEKTYLALQNNLISLRQATAQAIATEKQLENQLRKNEEQAATWENRSNSAKAQGNEDLTRQANFRRDQYKEAATALVADLEKQRETANNMRERLGQVEAEVQRAYVQKQVLISKERAAKAEMVINDILRDSQLDKFESAVESMEQRVLNDELRAALGAETRQRKDAELSHVNAILDRVENLIARLASSVEMLERNTDSD